MPSANEIHDRKVKFINEALASMDKEAVKWQTKLIDLLISEYFPLFDLEDGNLANTPKNDSLIGGLDKLIDKLEKALQRDVLGAYATNLLKSASFSAQYYVALGFKDTVVKGLLKNKVNLEGKLGFTPTGKLKKDGYLYRLGQTAAVRDQLKNYVITALTSETSFLDFQLGFRNLVKGNKRKKGLATNGALQSYFDQYAYDSFNQLDASTNKQLATNLGLEHFVYEGSIIKTSRQFCKDKAGKAFAVKDVLKGPKAWKKDKNLPKLKGGVVEPYNPLIERGRFRCRHFIKYITKELYDVLIKRQAA